MSTQTLSIELLKNLALMQFNGEEFTIRGDQAFDSEGNEIAEFEEVYYMVLTDEEADEKAADYIKESLWAFNATFLADMTDIPYEAFKAIADNGKCESNNEAIERIINKTCGMDEFVQAAVNADGRGHFLSGYDGNENEETLEGITFYIYRTN